MESIVLLPSEVELVHGPGCPVCVTSLEMIDKAHAIAQRPDVIFCSFGDMLRVPGSRGRSACAQIARRRYPHRLFADRLFEDRASQSRQEGRFLRHRIRNHGAEPTPCLSCRRRKQGVKNFSVLVSHVLVPPSIASILQSPLNRVQGFLGPGHVCTVMGYREYEPIAARFRVPIVITGFEPIDILQGALMTVRQLEAGTHEVENQYPRVVQSRRQPRRARSGQQGLRSLRSQMARRRFDPEKRLQTALRIPRPRCRANIRGEGDRHAGAGELHQRPGSTRRQKTARLRLLRQSNARRNIRSARPWSPPKARAPLTTPTVVI